MSEQDYMYQNNIPAESKPFVEDEGKPAKKDSSSTPKKAEQKQIGSAADEPKKKKGLFKKIFGKKE
jgi:penicillin-binding protein 1A